MRYYPGDTTSCTTTKELDTLNTSTNSSHSSKYIKLSSSPSPSTTHCNVVEKEEKDTFTEELAMITSNNNNDNNNNTNHGCHHQQRPYQNVQHQEVDATLAEFLNSMSISDQTEALHVMNDVESNRQRCQQHPNHHHHHHHHNSSSSSNRQTSTSPPSRLLPAPSTEFNQLSQLERETVLHDLHGVAGDSEESSPLLIQKGLLEMDACIQRLRNTKATSNDNDTSSPTNNNNAAIYDFCESKNPGYVRDWKLRWMFLRSCVVVQHSSSKSKSSSSSNSTTSTTSSFDPDAAAKRFLAFLEQKLQLFGPDLICETITLSSSKHFSKDDMDFMKKGAMQLVPARDRAGRAVIIIFPSLFGQAKSHENALRCFFYTFMLALKDESTQSSGIVVVIDACAADTNNNTNNTTNNNHGQPMIGRPDPRLFLKCTNLVHALPMKVQGRHFCTNDNLYGFFASYISRFHEKSIRIRSRVHVGSHIECMYSLMTFGIPVDRLPASTDYNHGLGGGGGGSSKAGRHVKFLTALKSLEGVASFFQYEYGNSGNNNNNNNNNHDVIQNVMMMQGSNNNNNFMNNGHVNNHNNNRTAMALAIVPNHADVLFGRGKPIQMHPCNVWLGTIVEDMVPIYYKESSRDGKTAVAQRVVAQVKERGGRFLKQYQDTSSSGSGSSRGSGGSTNSNGGAGIWIEVDDEQAQEKVCTAFRSCRATQKNKKNPQVHNNSNDNSNTVNHHDPHRKRARPV